AYRRAPEFPRIFPLIESVFLSKVSHIAALAVASMKAVAGYLDIRPDWLHSQSLFPNLHGEDRILAICKATGATEYIKPTGGRELYSRQRFETEGIRLHFLQPRPIEYKQFNNRFVPWLSIVDVLMFNSRDRVRFYLDQYDLV